MKNLIGVLLAICFFFFLFFLMLALTTPNGPIIKDWQYIGPFSAYEAQFPLQIEQRGPFSFRLRSEIRRAQESYLILYNVYASRIDLVRDGVVIDSMGQLEDDAHFWSALPIPFQFGEEGRGRTERIELVVYSREKAAIGRAPFIVAKQPYQRQSGILQVFSYDMFLISIGICFFISFMLVLMGKLTDSRTTYIAIGMSAFFNGLYLLGYVFPDSSASTGLSKVFTILQPITLVVCSYLICVGIESFLTEKISLAKKILWINVFGIFGYSLLFFVPIRHIQIFNLYLWEIPYLTLLLINMVVLLVVSFRSPHGARFIVSVTMFELTVAYELIRVFFLGLPQIPLIGYGSLTVILGYGLIFVWEFQKTYLELQTTSNQLFASYEEMTAMNEELENSYHELDKKVEQRTHELKVAMNSIKLLMDNTDEGFLSLGPDLTVEENYSSECEVIFGPDFTKESFENLLYPGNEELRAFIKTIIPKILAEETPSTRAMYLSLLPEEVTVRDRIIQMEYRVLESVEDLQSDKKMMVILKDITETRILETQIEEERNTLKMVIKVLVNREDFLESILDFKQFVGADIFHETLPDIYRIVHTFKGTFANFEMKRAVAALHEVENRINENRETLLKMEARELFDYLSQLKLQNCLIEDIEIIKAHLNPDFFDKDRQLLIEPERIVNIEKEILAELPVIDYEKLLVDLKRLRYIPFSQLLNHYPDYVSRLSQRMGKWINPVQITSDEILVDKELFKELARSLVHLFRNSVDHGIEAVEERVENGKDEYGSITLLITEEDRTLNLVFTDDGRGIDVSQVLGKAVEKGILTAESVNEASAQERYQMAHTVIFADNLSTTQETTILSGRGVGLASLKKAVEDLSGTIEVHSVPHEGTEFTIRIPLAEEKLEQISPETIMHPVLKNAIQTLKYYGVSLADEEYAYAPVEELELFAVSSFITIGGLFRSTFALSVDQNLAECLWRSFSLSEKEGEESNALEVEDAVGEISNIILGNSIRSMGIRDTGFAIFPPFTMRAVEATVRLPDNKIWCCQFHTKCGLCKIYFVGIES